MAEGRASGRKQGWWPTAGRISEGMAHARDREGAFVAKGRALVAEGKAGGMCQRAGGMCQRAGGRGQSMGAGEGRMDTVCKVLGR